MLSDRSASSDTVYLGGYMPQGYPPQGYAPQGYGYQAQPMYGAAASGCFAAQQCTGTYNEDRLSAEGVRSHCRTPCLVRWILNLVLALPRLVGLRPTAEHSGSVLRPHQDGQSDLER